MQLGTGPRLLPILLVCGGLLCAQQPKTNHPGLAEAFTGPLNCFGCRANIRIDSTLVQVPVTVTDRSGRFVQALPRGVFRVFEDGVEQEVTAFSANDVPVSVGLIFDTSGSMQSKLPMARLAVAQFLKVANPEDEFFLLRFDSVPRPASQFTSRAEMILDEVGRAGADGNTALLDAVYAGLREMKKAHNPRRVMLIISDGEDNHSHHTERAVHEVERESDVQIYAMAVHQVVYSRSRRIIPNGAALLKDLSVGTGGRSFEVDDGRDLARIAARIGLEIRNEYLVGYRPTNRNWDGKYRRITLKLNQAMVSPHLKAYWRRGYYAPLETGR